MAGAEITGVQIIRRYGVEFPVAEAAVDQHGRWQISRKAAARTEGVQRRRNQQAIDAARDHRLNAPRFRRDIVLAGDDKDFVAGLGGLGLPVRDQAGKEFIRQIRYHDTDGAGIAAPQARRHVVRFVAERVGGLHDLRAAVGAHAARAAEHIGDGRGRNAGAARHIADGRRRLALFRHAAISAHRIPVNMNRFERDPGVVCAATSEIRCVFPRDTKPACNQNLIRKSFYHGALTWQA